MATLRAAATVAAVDVDALVATAAAVFDQVRRLRFTTEGVVHPATGAVHAGLTDRTGTHPRPGTQYGLAELGPDGSVAVTLIELVDDDERLLRVRAVVEGARVDLRVRRPGRPREAELDVVVGGAETGFLRGDVDVEAALDLGASADHLPPTPVTGRARHRRAVGSFQVRLAVVPDGRWEVRLEVRARGRGIVRPVAAVALRVWARRIEAELQRALAEAVAPIDEAVAELDGRAPGPLAAELVSTAIADVPLVVVP